jgi:YD repeat-containing protein
VAASPDLFPRSSGSQLGRPLIQGEIYTEFLQDAVKRTEQIKRGHPLDTDTMIGAQASNDQLEKILSYIDIGRQEGAKILTGGERAGLGGELAGGYYMRPTVFEGNNAMRIFQEEIFGPSSTVDDVAGVDPARTTSYTYDTHGRRAKVTDPTGGVTTTGYDTFGALIDTVDPAGTEFTATYTTARHQLATSTVKGFTGDGQPARPPHTTATATLLTTTSRDERGLPMSTVDPRGTVTGATPAAFTTNYAYDALGRATTVTAPPVSAESNGQAAITVSPAATTGYNTYGELVDTRDPGSNVTHTDYDPAGRPTGTTLPAYTPPGGTAPITATTRTGYDAAGRVSSTTDARGNVTTYGYGGLSRKRCNWILLG